MKTLNGTGRTLGTLIKRKYQLMTSLWQFPLYVHQLCVTLIFFSFGKCNRGKPLKENFVRHVRALLATGSSARSVREQLYLNGGFFLSAQGYKQFQASMPELRWFQTQREGMGNESLLYSFMRIAKCDEVDPNPNPNPYPNLTFLTCLELRCLALRCQTLRCVVVDECPISA